MSKIYGEATPVGDGDGDGVIYTPPAEIVEAAARGDFRDQDMWDVHDLLLVGLARVCGGTCWQPERSIPKHATLLSPAGSSGWYPRGKWDVELHVGSHAEYKQVDPEWPPHGDIWTRPDGSWRGACRDAVVSRRRRIRESGRLPVPR